MPVAPELKTMLPWLSAVAVTAEPPDKTSVTPPCKYVLERTPFSKTLTLPPELTLAPRAVALDPLTYISAPFRIVKLSAMPPE